MRIFVSRLHFPVTTLGLGRRAGLWFQGCSLHCPGCVSADTWAHGLGATTLEAVMKTLTPWLAEADGVTISGGEPMEQPEALEELLAALRSGMRADQDVLLYSGQAWEKIAPQMASWRQGPDALICDPFLQSSAQTLMWRGSDNQRLVPLTALGRRRYEPWLHALREEGPKALDLFFDGDSVWMAGIPDAGSLAALQQALAAAGFSSTTSAAEHSPTLSPPVFA